ncbi:MAG: hypothetical protein JW918_05230 [Anaerolineae bacterium]|nr:hypothetical protein [Anaerolineae bacterium]
MKTHIKLTLCILSLLLGACCTNPTAIPDVPDDFQKGLNYTAWAREQLSTPESDHSLKNLAATGANWVAIVVFGYQQTYTSTVVTRDPTRTPTDEELAHTVATAHDLGLRVMLKPHVDLRRDRDHWRGNIGEAFTDDVQWRAWFESYGAFINHYAKLAQAHSVDQFCVGTELVGTSHREADWRKIVAGARERFSGPITYAGNHGTEDVGIAWWDALDFIGIDAYYVLTDRTDPTLDELKAAWVDKGYVETMANLAKKYDKPVLITEIGYRSADGTIKTPWDWDDLPLDLQEQADAYQAALDVLRDQPWLAGIYWWNWDVNPQKGGVEDKDYTPYGKPAEEVLRACYGGDTEPAAAPTPHPARAVEPAQLPAPSPASTHPGWTSYTATGHVNDLAFDHEGNLWIATPGGLLKWDIDSNEITRYTAADGLADNWVEKLAVAPSGELWVATSGGILRFAPSASGGTPAAGRSGHAWITYDKDNGLPCNGVTDIAFASNGDVWVSTYGCGVARFDGSTWTTYAEEDGLLERHVLCANAASNGSVLFGTWGGVAHFDGHNWLSYTTANGLISHGVETIAEDPAGGVWFGTWAGIGRLSGSLWTSYDAGGVGTWVESIAVDSENAAWAGTTAGIARFDPTTWAWHTVLAIDGQPEERGVSIAFAPDGSLWAGTYNSGIYHFDGSTADISSALTTGGGTWTNYTLHSSLPSNKVAAIATAPDGTLQVATRPDRYDQGGGTWQYDGHAWTRAPIEDSVAGGDAPSTVTAPDGAVWAIQERGVACFDDEQWTTYTVENGLIDDDVRSIAIAADGAVWVGTNDGLSRYVPPE